MEVHTPSLANLTIYIQIILRLTLETRMSVVSLRTNQHSRLEVIWRGFFLHHRLAPFVGQCDSAAKSVLSLIAMFHKLLIKSDMHFSMFEKYNTTYEGLIMNLLSGFIFAQNASMGWSAEWTDMEDISTTSRDALLEVAAAVLIIQSLSVWKRTIVSAPYASDDMEEQSHSITTCNNHIMDDDTRTRAFKRSSSGIMHGATLNVNAVGDLWTFESPPPSLVFQHQPAASTALSTERDVAGYYYAERQL